MFKFIRDGVPEEVPEERWKWEVQYNDNSHLRQFENGLFHQFKEIDQSNISYFKMVNRDNPEKGFVLIFTKGMKLIHFYLNSGVIDSEGQKEYPRIYVFGYEEKGKKHLFVIPPDDVIVYTNDLNSVGLEQGE